MIEGFKRLEYEDDLGANLITLETSSERSNLLEVFRSLKGIDLVKEKGIFKRYVVGEDVIARGNSMKLFKRRLNSNHGKYNFGNKMIEEWNKLPDYIVNISDINVFNGKLDGYTWSTRGD